ncbi:MAG: DsbA family protein [Candidatus Binataceae bacterium]|jgi:protein-disulfide isomerase
MAIEMLSYISSRAALIAAFVNGKCSIIGTAAKTTAAIALTIAALAVSACNSAPASAIAGTPDASQDAKLTAFLQKHFRIPEADYIKLGPPVPAPIAGLWSRTITASNGEGGSASSTIFVNEAGDKAIFGQFLDLNKDPWDRVKVSALHLDDRPTIGPATAPVTMVEFADFECPHCARAFPKAEAAVHRHEGQVRLVYKYFPLAGHTWARAAAIASECARVQNPDAFWDFAGAFYRDQASIDASNISDHIDTLIAQDKLDGKLMHACLLSKSADARVDQDLQDGDAVHVTSTPTLFINGIPLAGEMDDKVIDFVVSSELDSHHAAR